MGLISPWFKYFAGLALIAGFLLWFGNQAYDRGYAAAESRHAAEIKRMQIGVDSAIEVARQQASDLEDYRDTARILSMELDNEIRADGNACVPTIDELRRARKRWQGSN